MWRRLWENIFPPRVVYVWRDRPAPTRDPFELAHEIEVQQYITGRKARHKAGRTNSEGQYKGPF